MSTSDQLKETILQKLDQVHTTKHGITPIKAGRSTEPNGVILGHAIDTGERITLGEIEHRSGLYVLGKPGMGKSTLLVSLMVQYIKHGHGLLFLDPHGDAIDDLINRCDSERMENSFRLLDPQHEERSFGINLFSCKDITSWRQREDTYSKARWVFKKLFEKEIGEKPWLELIIEYTLYAFIENQEYTLNEVPRFLTNQAFRNHLVGNIKYEPQIAEFWQYSFKQKQAEAFHTRVTTLLGDTALRHIVSQRESTIDFAKIMQDREIVLVKLSTTLAPDVKKFIGTILINELIHAVQQRQYIPVDQRHQFCIFVDEMQDFTSFEDFSTLINEARKFGIATTFAHQERYGQLSEDKKIQGATAVAANKIFFQTTARDSQELAPEYAKPPPTEIKREPVLAISLDLFPTLLRGHDNPQIREFTRRYLRPLQYRLEDIKEEMEGEKLLRQYFVDIAGLYRVYERIAALKERLGYDPVKYINIQYNALEVQKDALMGALGQSEKLMSMHQGYTQLRLRLRSLNDFFTSLMEGRIAPGNEEFSLFIASFVCASSFSLVPFKYVKLLTLYISLKYGDPKIQRTIPYALAQAHGVFQKEVSLLTHQAMEKTRKARQEFQESYLKEKWNAYISDREWKAKELKRELAEIGSKRIYYDPQPELDHYQSLLEKCEKFEAYMLEHRLRDYLAIEGILSHRGIEWRILCDFEKEKRRIWLPPRVYELYVWLLAYPDLWNLLSGLQKVL